MTSKTTERIFTLTEFDNYCRNELKPLYYVYSTVNQGEEYELSSIQMTSIYKSMDFCLAPNLLSFKNGRSTLTFNRVRHVIFKGMKGILYVFQIVCANGDTHIITTDASA